MEKLEAERIRIHKQEEAEQLYKKLGIEKMPKNDFLYGINKYDFKKSEITKTKFHWTRLSTNSNVTNTID
ncbi:hypothetical protein N0B16_07560 [Chryseobacterium sp. GMJ5]|uniref:Uncharacterized protein n=1 Tax=Chryseobacterium gilvum TaxID=2976534 RepID=A0ABT2VWC0_9FLAO|nr:hypothetical protein [Chryseobacterium gilvum]MCU7614290.1 hypothetical protein [Chryseobacterium gilvum]